MAACLLLKQKQAQRPSRLVSISYQHLCSLFVCTQGAGEVVEAWLGNQATLLPGQYLAALAGYLHSTPRRKVTTRC